MAWLRVPRLALLSLCVLLAACDGPARDPGPCDGGPIGMRCYWNNETQAFDRDCTVTCQSPLCGGGTQFRNGVVPMTSRRCQWDEATQSFTRDCTMECPADGGADSAPGS